MRARFATAAALVAAAVIIPTIAVVGSAPAAATFGWSDDDRCPEQLKDWEVFPNKAESVEAKGTSEQLVRGYCVKVRGVSDYVALDSATPSTLVWQDKHSNVTHYWVDLISKPGAPTPTPVPELTPTPTPTPTIPPVDPDAPFDWNWRYAAPTCDALTVTYPANLPSGQSNDINIRLATNLGEVTLNYHNNESTWSGTTSFVYSQHRSWPAGVTSYDVTWIQVAGTNYHWQEGLRCVLTSDGDPTTLDVPQAVTDVTGFRTGTVTVKRGTTLAADSVEVEQLGLQTLTLERYVAGTSRPGSVGRSAGAWTAVRTVTTTDRGTAQVTFPRLTKRGTYKFRLNVAGNEVRTGDTTGTLTVRVR